MRHASCRASWKRRSEVQDAAAIDAVVVAYNSDASLDECLTRLRNALDVARIVVVDNGSSDASIQLASRHAAQDARVSLVHLENNPGFAAACNAGASISDAPWVAFVNPDCLLEPDSLQRMRVLAHSLEGIGVLGADLVDAEGRRDPAARRRDPDPRRLLRALGSPGSIAVTPTKEPLQVLDAVSGALMLMPGSAFLAIGGFDTGYRLHAEDLDLCRRARAAGFVVAVANEVRVVHLRGTSSQRRPVWVEWQKHRSLWRYFTRFQTPPGSWLWWRGLQAAIWTRFLLAATRAWWRAQRS